MLSSLQIHSRVKEFVLCERKMSSNRVFHGLPSLVPPENLVSKGDCGAERKILQHYTSLVKKPFKMRLFNEFELIKLKV